MPKDAETFEEAWDAKYAAEPGGDEHKEVAAAEPAAEPSEQPTPAAEAPEQPQGTPQPEPAHVEPASPSPKADEGGEDFRTKYEGTKARYQAEERKRKAAEQRAQDLERRLQDLETKSAPPSAKVAPGLNLDEVEIGEIEAFRKAHPEIAKATVDDPKLAARWQKLLIDRGEDEVILTFETARGAASGPAEEGKATAEQVRAELQRRDFDAHLKAIESEHPDWQSVVLNPAPQHEQDVYHPDFVQWVGLLPMQVGQGVVWALKNGTSAQVNKVIKAFKEYRAHSQAKSQPPRGQASTPPPRTPQQQAAVNGAMAVPAKGTPPPKARPGQDASFEDLWDAKYGNK